MTTTVKTETEKEVAETIQQEKTTAVKQEALPDKDEDAVMHEEGGKEGAESGKVS